MRRQQRNQSVAIVVAACSGQTLVGMLAMIRARLSIASGFGNPVSLPASCHRSFPSRANTETTLRVMPFASVPAGAKRNSFSPECLKAKASELGILSFHNGMNRDRISSTAVADTTCSVPVFTVSDMMFGPRPPHERIWLNRVAAMLLRLPIWRRSHSSPRSEDHSGRRRMTRLNCFRSNYEPPRSMPLFFVEDHAIG